MNPVAQGSYEWVVRLRLWARRAHLSRKLAAVLAVAAVISGMATVMTMTGTVRSRDLDTVVWLLYLDVVLMLVLAAVVARRLVSVWLERRRGLAGAGLHIRLVVLFSLVAVTPAILVAVFTAIFINIGLQGWFSERVSTAIGASGNVARAYLQENRNSIRADALAIANELNENAPNLRTPGALQLLLTAESSRRSIPEALIIDGSGRVIARSGLSMSLEFALVPPEALEAARRGEIPVLTAGTDDRVRAVIRLIRFVDAYLLVGRLVDPGILVHLQRVERAVSQYQNLQKESRAIQISFVLIFILVAMLLLLASVWIGLTIATQLARPLSDLIGAAERVRKGDLTVRVDAGAREDEISTLGRAFNRMTGQLESQQQGLMEANRQLDERRRFTETVLAGVSAGVVGLDAAGRIHLPNRSASELVEIDLANRIGEPLRDVVPEMATLLDDALTRPDRLMQAEIRIPRKGRFRTLLVRVAAERLEGAVIGYVVTFDDVTELLAAQRTAAWADVARRIAHEIKNPLTPIQLSAERLRRKYLKEIQTDPEVFATCTETIVRQVEDIGRMVDEFSAFARMPQATMKVEDLSEICRQAAFLERTRRPDIDFDLEFPAEEVRVSCDSRQISRAVANLLKNAAEAIDGCREARADAAYRGRIRMRLTAADAAAGAPTTIVIEDNGKGFPEEFRDRLTEPYVTTRAKGTGLGLAIVKKIMEDHNGDLILEDADGGGARAVLRFRGSGAKGEPPAATTTSERDDPQAPAGGLRAQVS